MPELQLTGKGVEVFPEIDHVQVIASLMGSNPAFQMRQGNMI
jgi:hypothetical protein